ncbi:probable inactive purple acid phosphatase 2 [Malania oleifera]|uniref:probable inactive purple acid phosphatase 2 n=1 Tax=Malania oleifera TaxID=397392 RepID=UPI0025ADDDA3|nr:probable inactive purple acid phosphatase 2 [Malania oleifera]
MISPRPPFFFFFFFSAILHLSSSSSASISIYPQVLPKSGDPVRINWTGIDSPSDLDWLGIYCPPDSPSDDFIGYVFLSSCPTWQSGSGSVHLPLVNLRSPYEFRIFRWARDEIDKKRHDHDHNPLPGTKHLLAKSGPLRFEAGRGPEQIHLAYTDRDDEMRVMFITGDGKESLVRYGLGEDRMSEVVGTQVTTYRSEDMCDSPANSSAGWRDPGYIHDGVMRNLKKGKRYYYQVGSESGGWSITHSFMSRNGDSDETIAFLFGDMGAATPYSTFIRTQDESKSTIKWILRDLETLGEKPAFVSHIGDISYARGYAWLWDTFFTQIEPVASKVPYHVCIGNHEYDWPLQPWRPDWSTTIYGKDGGGECGVPYSLKFNMPGNYSEPTGTRAPATRNLFYSFDMGVVHFVYISTETNFLPGSSQYNFIKQDLESVDRKRTPFVVVQGHRPMYTTSNEYRDTPIRVRLLKHLEPLFVKNNVTLALWGHVHRYERFCPLNNFTCGSMGLKGEDWEALPVHVVIGMGGQDWQPIWEPRADHPNDPIFPQPERSMYRGGEFGYTRIVALREKLTLSYVGNHDGEVHDMVDILASGQVLSGNGGDGAAENGEVVGSKSAENRGEVVEPKFSWYVKGAGVLVLGAFIGYMIGFLSHSRKGAGSRKDWMPVKNEET